MGHRFFIHRYANNLLEELSTKPNIESMKTILKNLQSRSEESKFHLDQGEANFIS